jgi:CBS domain-containing protein
MSEVITVAELMVPLDEYATVDESATLFEAVVALERAQERYSEKKVPYLHRAILVLNKDKDVVGKISQHDVLRALEPRYEQVGDTRALSRAGLSANFLRTMMENFAFCDASLSDMCGKASNLLAAKFMYTPQEGEKVEADSSLCEAVHMLVMGQHQSLLVVENGKIVGVLRLADVFMKIYAMMKQCNTS